MAETTTLNYGWTMPDPGASANTWGSTLNATTQKIDAQVKVNELAMDAGQAPIGSITMFGSITPPAGWLICDGSSLLQTGAYAALFAIIGTTFGSVDSTHFTLPDLRGVFPSGVSASSLIGAKGGAATVTLDETMIPPHTHAATQPAHGHAATQAAHAHAIATGSHSHAITTGGHSHTLSAQVLTPNGGGNATAGSGWAFTSPTTSAVGNLGGNTDTAGNLGGNTDTQAPAITVPAAQPAITVANTGGGLGHNNLPPFLSIPFIIRYA